ncbi:MAG: RNA polymerase sigma-54 factor [Bdellovibrionales bacterium RIFOXYD1_FULL_53_11]|nr:MAG: RNA polymerase sigma-54 factor [Bdellovibrionales bacterium RIFOXYD1_FULL_53_11]
MALEIKQSLRLSQQLVMTPQLQQAIKLLQLSRMELSEVINQELVENPILEETAESAEGESTASREEGEAGAQDPEGEQRRDEEASMKEAPKEDQLVTGKEDDFNWESYVEEFNSSYSPAPSMKEVNEDLPSFENILTKTTSLEEHLMWQLSMATFSEQEKKFGQLIIGNLSDDGYIKADFAELAREAGMELEDAEETLKLIQNFDPVGVASRNLQECLMAQARFMRPRQPLVEKIIETHLGELERKNYHAIARAEDTPLEKVIIATKLILELEPKPGRSFHANDTHYITPDIYVYKVGGEFVIVLNEDGMPKLRISPYYKNILSSAKKDGNKMTKEYVQEKLRSAVWLIRSIHNRQKTIYKVTEAIVKRQRDFFEKGVQHLRPMILKDVASDIGMHESTISRVTTNKYVHTPVGIFELKYFFNSSIGAADGGDSLASEAVKEKIRQLISKEDPKNPLSDQRLAELLKTDNIDIARRTVAKYREMLGMLSSGKRKKVL